MTDLIEKWISLIDKCELSNKSKSCLKAYAILLLEKNLPVIFDLKHIAIWNNLKLDILRSMVNSNQSFYHQFTIPKRNGSNREINAPYPSLMLIQSWIKENILSRYEVHQSAFAYVKGRSVVDNAKAHVGCKSLIKVDIKDFFPSIAKERVIAVFKYLGYTNKVSYFLASLCTLNNSLPQGAPTSPDLSNIICKRLDIRLSQLAKSLDLKYSRYADDLFFSGNKVHYKMVEYIRVILNSEGFLINDSKTKVINDEGKKIITGISISSGKMTLPKTSKRTIRQDVHYFLKFAYNKGFLSRYENDPIFVDRLIGKLQFWKMVEPENKYVQESIISIKLKIKEIDKFSV